MPPFAERRCLPHSIHVYDLRWRPSCRKVAIPGRVRQRKATSHGITNDSLTPRQRPDPPDHARSRLRLALSFALRLLARISRLCLVVVFIVSSLPFTHCAGSATHSGWGAPPAIVGTTPPPSQALGRGSPNRPQAV